MKKVLVVCTKYPLEYDNTWLTRELSEYLSNMGYIVDVLCIDWDCQNPIGKYHLNNVKIYNQPTVSYFFSKKARLSVKWLLASLIASSNMFSLFKKKHDLVIYFSPCISSWFCILLGKFFFRKSLLIYWDFFPIHQMQIGLLTSKIGAVFLKKIENMLVNLMSFIGCMSPKNHEFFNEYFRPKKKIKIFELPIWSEPVSVLIKTKKNILVENIIRNRPGVYFVFGGQLDYGRGIESILEAAKLARAQENNIKIIIVGRGRLAEKVKIESNKYGSNIIYSDFIPRNEYLNLLSLCRAGIVATVPNVSVPTYPSKSLDYMKMKIPIIASVENSTDFGYIVTSNGAGISCKVGDSILLSDALVKLARDPEGARIMGENANKLFKKRHDITVVMNKLINEIFEKEK